MGFVFFLIFVVGFFAAIPLFMFPIALVEKFKYGEKGIPEMLLSFLVTGVPILVYFLVPSPHDKFDALSELPLMQRLLIVGWLILIIGSLVFDFKRFSRNAEQQAEARRVIDDARAARKRAIELKQAEAQKVIDDARAARKREIDLQKEALYYADWIKIKDGYSYARDRLKSHIGMPSGEQKTMEILDDVIRVVSEYIPGQNRKIAAWDFGELTSYLSNIRNQGVRGVIKAEKEIKMMRPILAGLKKLVLVGDCSVDEQEIPDDVDKILEIKGPREVDDVVRYLSSMGLG